MYIISPVSEEPARRIKKWLKLNHFSHEKISAALSGIGIHYSKSSVDSFCSARRKIPQDFAKAISALDAQRIVEQGGDPNTAIRWQYLVGQDDLPTKASKPMFDAWEQVQQEEKHLDQLFLKLGYQCQRVIGGFLLTPEGETSRRISLKEMEQIQEDIQLFLKIRIARAYKNGKELAPDNVDHEKPD